MKHWSPDGRAYVAIKPIPGKGVLTYLSVTPQPDGQHWPFENESINIVLSRDLGKNNHLKWNYYILLKKTKRFCVGICFYKCLGLS